MLDPILLLGLVVAVLVMSLAARALSYYFRLPFIIFLLIEGIMPGPKSSTCSTLHSISKG